MRPGPKLASPCRQHDLLLALGSISPPEYTARRMAQRLTWMTSDDVGPSGSICAMFIMRTGMMPQPLMLAAERESAVYGDMLLANTIVWNETRVRGPTLSLGWWLSYASHELRHARFVGKIDDDTYLHIPDLSALLQHVHAGVSPSAYVYLGVLTYYQPKVVRQDDARVGPESSLECGQVVPLERSDSAGAPEGVRAIGLWPVHWPVHLCVGLSHRALTAAPRQCRIQSISRVGDAGDCH